MGDIRRTFTASNSAGPFHIARGNIVLGHRCPVLRNYGDTVQRYCKSHATPFCAMLWCEGGGGGGEWRMEPSFDDLKRIILP